jgi:hypothetical protein
MFLEIFVNFHISSENLKQIAEMKKPINWKNNAISNPVQPNEIFLTKNKISEPMFLSLHKD